MSTRHQNAAAKAETASRRSNLSSCSRRVSCVAYTLFCRLFFCCIFYNVVAVAIAFNIVVCHSTQQCNLWLPGTETWTPALSSTWRTHGACCKQAEGGGGAVPFPCILMSTFRAFMMSRALPGISSFYLLVSLASKRHCLPFYLPTTLTTMGAGCNRNHSNFERRAAQSSAESMGSL